MSTSISNRYVLDEAKRQSIIALISNGSSRRVAARYVGCAPATISRTAARDPHFAEQLAHAEHQAEIKLLRSVQIAADEQKYWRAAAWLLERRRPTHRARGAWSSSSSNSRWPNTTTGRMPWKWRSAWGRKCCAESTTMDWEIGYELGRRL